MSPRHILKAVHMEVQDTYGFDYDKHYRNAIKGELFSNQLVMEREIEVENYKDYLRNAEDHPYLWQKGHTNYLSQAMRLAYVEPTILFCVDIEAWEKNNNLITEIGIAIYDPTLQRKKKKGKKIVTRPSVQSIHVIIEENEELLNGEYVLDHKFHFTGDVGMIMDEYDTKRYLQNLVHYYFITIPKMIGRSTVLVGHALSGDVKWLKKMGVTFPQSASRLDTQKIWATTRGMKNCSLSKTLDFMRICNQFLHNAGNDAYYTLLLCLALCNPTVRMLRKVDHADYEIQLFESYSHMDLNIIGFAGHDHIDDFKEALIKTFGFVKQRL